MQKLELIKKMAKNIDLSLERSEPYYNKFLDIVQSYFKENKITEISVIAFCDLVGGIRETLSLDILVCLNKRVFNK